MTERPDTRDTAEHYVGRCLGYLEATAGQDDEAPRLDDEHGHVQQLTGPGGYLDALSGHQTRQEQP